MKTHVLFTFLFVAAWLAGSPTTSHAQEGAFEQSSARLNKMVRSHAKDGYRFEDGLVSIAGGFLKKDEKGWVTVATVKLKTGKHYAFMAAGDNDAQDVDIRIMEDEKVLAANVNSEPNTVVAYTPNRSGTYVVQLRLYASRGGVPCVCLSAIMSK